MNSLFSLLLQFINLFLQLFNKTEKLNNLPVPELNDVNIVEPMKNTKQAINANGASLKVSPKIIGTRRVLEITQ